MPKSKLVGAVAIGTLLVAAVAITWELMPQSTVAAGNAMFSVDDGATYFAGDESQVPPFEHDGRTAVRAHVYRDPMTSKPVVAYLSRYTEAGKRQMTAAIEGAKTAAAAQRGENVAVPPPVHFGSADLIEVKAPGSGQQWTPIASQDGLRISNPTAPDGTPLEAVTP